MDRDLALIDAEIAQELGEDYVDPLDDDNDVDDVDDDGLVVSSRKRGWDELEPEDEGGDDNDGNEDDENVGNEDEGDGNEDEGENDEDDEDLADIEADLEREMAARRPRLD